MSPKFGFHCRTIIDLGLPASNLLCRLRVAFKKFVAWYRWTLKNVTDYTTKLHNLLSGYNWNPWKKNKFADDVQSAQEIVGWKTKINNCSTMESELWRNAGASALKLQETNFLNGPRIWTNAYATLKKDGISTRKWERRAVHNADADVIAGWITDTVVPLTHYWHVFNTRFTSCTVNSATDHQTTGQALV